MIVKDEAEFLDDALRSVAGVVDEICVVDTGSSDATREIARAHGARVLDVPWQDDFAHARNAALGMATRRWIFVLDADERLDAASRETLRAIGTTSARARGKWLTCRNLTDSVKGAGAMTNALVRVFPNDPRIRYRNPIHEFVAFDGCAGGLAADRTTIEIVHHGYLTPVVMARNKGERNLRLSRRAVERDGGDSFHQYNLGMALLLSGDRDAAIAALERTRELLRDSPRGFRVHALITLADLYAEHRGDLGAAFRLVHECLALVPNYSNAHYSHGKLLARSGDLHAARDAFGRAIAAGAHDREQFVVDNEIAIWKAAGEIGATLMVERRFAQALGWFELASRERPAALPLILNRGKCHEALGDDVAAQALFAAAFTGYRDEGSAVEWINFLLRRGRTDDALAAIDTALSFVVAATGTLLLGSGAAALLQAGQPDQARTAIERAFARAPGPECGTMLAALAAQLGTSGLAELVASAVASARAKPLRIAYLCAQ